MTTSQASVHVRPATAPPASGDAEAGSSGPLARLKQIHASLRASNRAYALLTTIVLHIKEDDPSLLARQAAYSLLYAVPSILVLLVSLAAIADQNTGSGISSALQQTIAEQAPADLQPLLESLVQYALVETSQNTAIVAGLISLAVALWSATGGVGAQIYAINAVYDIKDRRSFVKQAVTKIGLMLLGGVMVIAAFFLMAFGQTILDWAPELVRAGGVLSALLSAGLLWGMALLLGALLLLYWFGLDTPKSFRWLLPGAVTATVAIGIVIALLDRILTYTNPGAAYGLAGSVLILLWTLFILSAIVIVGAIINAVLGRRHDPKLIAGLQSRPPQLPRGKRIAITTYR